MSATAPLARPGRAAGGRARTVAVTVGALLLATVGARAALPVTQPPPAAMTDALVQAREELARASAASAKAAEAGHLQRARLALSVRRHLERAVALAPSDPDVLAELALFHLSAPWLLGGRLDRAEALGARIGAKRPSRGMLIQGWVAHHRGARGTAERLFLESTRLSPDDGTALLALGHLYVDQERADDAIHILARGLALQPDNRTGHLELGTIAASTGTHLDAGEASLKAVLALPGPAGRARHVAHRRLGMIYEKQGRPALALPHYEAALAERGRRREYQDAVQRVR